MRLAREVSLLPGGGTHRLAIARTPTSTPCLANSSLAAMRRASMLRCASARGIGTLAFLINGTAFRMVDSYRDSVPLQSSHDIRPDAGQGGLMNYRTLGSTG